MLENPNWGPRRSPAKRVRWGEADSPYQGEMSRRDRGDREEQGSGMTDAHTWASGIERTLRRRSDRPRKWGPGDDSPCQGEMARRARGGRDKGAMSAHCVKALIGAVPRRSQGELPRRGKREWPGPLVLSIAGKNIFVPLRPLGRLTPSVPAIPAKRSGQTAAPRPGPR